MPDETTPPTDGTEAAQGAPETAEGEAKPAKAPKAKAADGAEKPAKAKKEKAPALEDKPFTEYVNQDFIPALTKTLAKVGISDLTLKLEKLPLPIPGADSTAYSQVVGHWQNGQRQFAIVFSKDDVQAPKFFYCADYGARPSNLESFMIDERKVNLDLLLLYAVQRLNGQKWLVRN